MSVRLLLILLTFPLTAHAYVGPGFGLAGLSGLFALLMAFGTTLWSFIWLPVKKRLGLGKNKEETDTAGSEEDEGRDESNDEKDDNNTPA